MFDLHLYSLCIHSTLFTMNTMKPEKPDTDKTKRFVRSPNFLYLLETFEKTENRTVV